MHRLPLAEDHDGQRQEARAGDADLKAPGLNAGDDIGHAADAAEQAGDQHARIAHLVHVDADRIGCLGVFAAGAQAQAEAGLVHDDIADDKQHDAQRDEDAELQVADLEQERAVGVADLGRGGTVIVLGQDHGQRRGQHIEGCAADGLVRLEIDGRKRQQQRVNHTGQRRHQDGQHHEQPGGHGALEHGDGEHAAQAADDHDALQRNVDDAGVFAEHAAQRHQHQDDAVQQGIFDQ